MALADEQLHALTRAYEDAVADAVEETDLVAGFAELDRIRDTVRDLAERIRRQRAEQAVRIRERDVPLSFAELGRKIGYSKPRAEQLVKEAQDGRKAD